MVTEEKLKEFVGKPISEVKLKEFIGKPISEVIDSLSGETETVYIGSGSGYFFAGRASSFREEVSDLDEKTLGTLERLKTSAEAEIAEAQKRLAELDKDPKGADGEERERIEKAIRLASAKRDRYIKIASEYVPIMERKVKDAFRREACEGVAIIITGEENGPIWLLPGSGKQIGKDDLDMEGVTKLSIAIIEAAASDFAHAIKKTGTTHFGFFHSDWFKALTSIDGDYLEQKIVKDYQAVLGKNRKNCGRRKQESSEEMLD